MNLRNIFTNSQKKYIKEGLVFFFICMYEYEDVFLIWYFFCLQCFLQLQCIDLSRPLYPYWLFKDKHTWTLPESHVFTVFFFICMYEYEDVFLIWYFFCLQCFLQLQCIDLSRTLYPYWLFKDKNTRVTCFYSFLN